MFYKIMFLKWGSKFGDKTETFTIKIIGEY